MKEIVTSNADDDYESNIHRVSHASNRLMLTPKINV